MRKPIPNPGRAGISRPCVLPDENQCGFCPFDSDIDEFCMEVQSESAATPGPITTQGSHARAEVMQGPDRRRFVPSSASFALLGIAVLLPLCARWVRRRSSHVASLVTSIRQAA